MSDTVQRNIPHEPGNTMRFRQLTERELTEAKVTALRRRVYDPSGEHYQPGQCVDGYDEGFLVRCGLVDWAGSLYSESFSPEEANELDPRTHEWAARQVLALIPREERRALESQFVIPKDRRG